MCSYVFIQIYKHLIHARRENITIPYFARWWKSLEIALPSQTLASNRLQRRNALAGNRHSQAPFALKTSKHNFHSIRQARTGRIFNHLLCRKVGTHGSSFHSLLVPNGRHARVEFSLTSRAERQTRLVEFSLTSRAERQASPGRSSFHLPLVANSRQARVEFSLTSSCRFPSNLQTNPLAWGLGGLHDHHRLTNDRRSFPGQNA
ncbi:unnamed protein product [Prunus brigantina]